LVGAGREGAVWVAAEKNCLSVKPLFFCGR